MSVLRTQQTSAAAPSAKKRRHVFVVTNHGAIAAVLSSYTSTARWLDSAPQGDYSVAQWEIDRQEVP